MLVFGVCISVICAFVDRRGKLSRRTQTGQMFCMTSRYDVFLYLVFSGMRFVRFAVYIC